jgi:hypothetical protein
MHESLEWILRHRARGKWFDRTFPRYGIDANDIEREPEVADRFPEPEPRGYGKEVTDDKKGDNAGLMID